MAQSNRKTVAYLDEAWICDEMRTTFFRKNFEYVGVSDEEDLLQVLALVQIDVIMIAAELKKMDGNIDFDYGTRVQRILFDRGLRRPIILTSTQMEKGPIWFMERGEKMMTAIITKPRFEGLDQAVNKILSDEGAVLIKGEEREISDDRYWDNCASLFLVTQDDRFEEILKQTFAERQYSMKRSTTFKSACSEISSYDGICGIVVLDMRTLDMNQANILRETARGKRALYFIPIGRNLIQGAKHEFSRMGWSCELEFPVHLPSLVATVKEIAIENKALG